MRMGRKKLNGLLVQINSQGALTPAGREALMAEAHSRIQSCKMMHDQNAERCRGIAKRNRANPEDIVHDFGESNPWKAPKAAAPFEIDGYKIRSDNAHIRHHRSRRQELRIGGPNARGTLAALQKHLGGQSLAAAPVTPQNDLAAASEASTAAAQRLFRGVRNASRANMLGTEAERMRKFADDPAHAIANGIHLARQTNLLVAWMLPGQARLMMRA
jgi:hypothetical protein